MIEVEVRVDHEHHLLRTHAEVEQAILECRWTALATVLDAVDLVELVVLFAPRPGVDQDRADVVLDEQATHAKLNTIACVGGNPPLPERLGNDTEHSAAVQLLTTRLNGVNGPCAEASSLDPWAQGARR